MGGRTLKASFRVTEHDAIHIEIPPAPPSELIPLDRPLDRLYEDDDLVVVNKPAGLVVHPAAGHAQDTLVNILLHHVGQLAMGFAENRPGIVHRLDRDTSGVLVVAKNDRAHHGLAHQFRTKSVHRIYWAIVYGVPRALEGTSRSYLARHPRDRKRFASAIDGVGKFAVTHYKILQSLSSFAWLNCQLETGRTHQIRVHLSELGNPIVGDSVYGSRTRVPQAPVTLRPLLGGLARVALHACELGFVHPRTQKSMMFQVGWPPELRELVTALGFQDV